MDKESIAKLKAKLGKPAIMKRLYAYILKVIAKVRA